MTKLQNLDIAPTEQLIKMVESINGLLAINPNAELGNMLVQVCREIEDRHDRQAVLDDYYEAEKADAQSGREDEDEDEDEDKD